MAGVMTQFPLPDPMARDDRSRLAHGPSRAAPSRGHEFYKATSIDLSKHCCLILPTFPRSLELCP
jgi:hypothetical protein